MNRFELDKSNEKRKRGDTARSRRDREVLRPQGREVLKPGGQVVRPRGRREAARRLRDCEVVRLQGHEVEVGRRRGPNGGPARVH